MLPGPARCLLQDGRVCHRDLGGEHVRRGVGGRAAGPAHHRLRGRRPASRGAVRRKPEPALPAEHADDRAAALRHDDGRGDVVAEWVDQGRAEMAARGRPGAHGRAHDAIRSVADHVAIVALAGIVMLRRGQRLSAAVAACGAAGALPGDRRRPVRAEQPLDDRPLVRDERLLRRRERGERAGWSRLASKCRSATYQLSGPGAGLAGLCLRSACPRRLRAIEKHAQRLVLVLALAASAALPWYAYFNGHPLRVRYSLPLVFAACAFCGVGVGLLPRRVRAARRRRCSSAASCTRLAARSLERPMVLEAQRDNANRAGRTRRDGVSRSALRLARDSVIMASMGSLAHYIQDLSAYGFQVRNFLHEGNGDLWVFAVEQGPHGFADWVLVEEKAEGGDALFHRARGRCRSSIGDSNGSRKVGGVALYRANAGNESLEAEVHCRTRCPAADKSIFSPRKPWSMPPSSPLACCHRPSAPTTKASPTGNRAPKTISRTDRRSARPEVARQNVEVRFNEFPDFRVLPGEDADARPNVRLNGTASPERKKSQGAVIGTMRSLSRCSISV